MPALRNRCFFASFLQGSMYPPRLLAVINCFVAEHNKNSRPVVWRKGIQGLLQAWRLLDSDEVGDHTARFERFGARVRSRRYNGPNILTLRLSRFDPPETNAPLTTNGSAEHAGTQEEGSCAASSGNAMARTPHVYAAAACQFRDFRSLARVYDPDRGAHLRDDPGHT